MEFFEMTFNIPDDIEGKKTRADLSFAYDGLGDAWYFAADTELASMCRAKGDLVLYGSPERALQSTLLPWNLAWTLHTRFKHMLNERTTKAIEESVDVVARFIEKWPRLEDLARLLKDVDEYRRSPEIKEAFRKRGFVLDWE